MALIKPVEVIGEDEGDDGHQLHDNVESRARGVLERVTDSVADDSSLVALAALAAKGLSKKGLAVLARELDKLFAIVPCAARVAHGDGEHDGAASGRGEHSAQGIDTEKGAGD